MIPLLIWGNYVATVVVVVVVANDDAHELYGRNSD